MTRADMPKWQTVDCQCHLCVLRRAAEAADEAQWQACQESTVNPEPYWEAAQEADWAYLDALKKAGKVLPANIYNRSQYWCREEG